MRPAEPGTGIQFRRCDVAMAANPGAAVVLASLEAAVPAQRRLLLESAGLQVSTPEHLLAALYGLGISDAEVELWGDEVPFLDGSSRPFAEALWTASTIVADAPRVTWDIARAFALHRGTAICRLIPAEDLQLVARLDFGPSSPLRPQRLTWRADDPSSFLCRLAPARSFGFAAEAAALRSRGLARGARLRNVLVYDTRRLLNPEGTRFADEPVRHKLLDGLGALALLGAPLRGRLILDRCSHSHLVATLRAARASGVLALAQRRA